MTELWNVDASVECVYKADYWGCNDEVFVEKLASLWGSDSTCITPIPRVIHFIWLGSTLPTHFQPLIESWRCMHTSWEIRIWSDNDIAAALLPDMTHHFHAARNFGMKSDILRYCVQLSHFY